MQNGGSASSSEDSSMHTWTFSERLPMHEIRSKPGYEKLRLRTC
jgi:hypothetical protein